MSFGGFIERLFGTTAPPQPSRPNATIARLRAEVDMNLVEACNANRVHLDIVEQNERAKRTLFALVEHMQGDHAAVAAQEASDLAKGVEP